MEPSSTKYYQARYILDRVKGVIEKALPESLTPPPELPRGKHIAPNISDRILPGHVQAPSPTVRR